MARRYANLNPDHVPHGRSEVFRWMILDRLTGKRRRMPAGPPAPAVAANLDCIRSDDPAPRLTWIGHASYLASLGGRHFLFDPVFSNRIATVVRRHSPPGLLPDQLPPIEATFVSHVHYDHLDRRSILALPQDMPFVVPAGVGAFLRGWGRNRVYELEWWQSVELDSARVTLVPAQHWSRRTLSDTNRTLWGGFVVETDRGTVYHAGDSSAFDGFAEIGRRFPGMLAAMLPIGSYDPPWFMEHFHLNPEQAGEAFLSLGARQLAPMHWGAFRLTDEPLAEPMQRMRVWWNEQRPAGRHLHCLSVGETVELA
jgi:L-ascorbate metabolism protein UlaG (beta-lactamase superfamily)